MLILQKEGRMRWITQVLNSGKENQGNRKKERNTRRASYLETERIIANDGETPVIAISADLTIKDAVEIFAHELAHVAAGAGAGHRETWQQEFEKIFQEYHRVGREMFPEQER